MKRSSQSQFNLSSGDEQHYGWRKEQTAELMQCFVIVVTKHSKFESASNYSYHLIVLSCYMSADGPSLLSFFYLGISF